MSDIKGEFDYSDYSFLSDNIARYEGFPQSAVSLELKGHTLSISEAKKLKDRIESLYMEKFIAQGLTKEEAEDEFVLHVLQASLNEAMTHVQVSRN